MYTQNYVAIQDSDVKIAYRLTGNDSYSTLYYKSLPSNHGAMTIKYATMYDVKWSIAKSHYKLKKKSEKNRVLTCRRCCSYCC